MELMIISNYQFLTYLYKYRLLSMLDGMGWVYLVEFWILEMDIMHRI